MLLTLYAAVGTAATHALAEATALLQQAGQRGLALEPAMDAHQPGRGARYIYKIAPPTDTVRYRTSIVR